MQFKTGSSKKVAYFSPLIMLIIGVFMYSFILPARYNKVIGLIDWLFSGQDNIIATLRSSDIVLGHAYKIFLTKVIVWIWSMGMLISIYMCGLAIHYKDDNYNVFAKYKGNAWKGILEEVLLKVRLIKSSGVTADVSEVYNEVRILRELCDSMGDFGKGDNEIIELETKIVENLSKLKVICDKVTTYDEYLVCKSNTKSICGTIKEYILKRENLHR